MRWDGEGAVGFAELLELRGCWESEVDSESRAVKAGLAR